MERDREPLARSCTDRRVALIARAESSMGVNPSKLKSAKCRAEESEKEKVKMTARRKLKLTKSPPIDQASRPALP